MKRKNFIQSSIGVLTAPYLPGLSALPTGEDETVFVSPAYLKAGDIIGITASAGYITRDEIRSAVQKMESWGYKIIIGDTIDKRDFTFGGTDEERTNDLQQMLDDPKIKAIMCARGGYGVVRIIDKLNWERFKVKPKWIIGFSDATVFHSHLSKNLGIASIHSKMCNSFPDDWSLAEPIQVETIESIQLALSGKKMKYEVGPHPQNKIGTAEGILIGGNLKMLETLAGTKSDINTAGKILFLEDTGEYMYNVDRMFWNLKRTGKLSQLKGLIIGGFKIKIDEGADDFGRSLQDVVLEKVKAYKYPVCFDFPVGHQKNNYALKCGVKHRLTIAESQTILQET
ncbi:MAG TPA: LD-carboxypeptidase [Chitinophagaceae bacterium]